DRRTNDDLADVDVVVPIAAVPSVGLAGVVVPATAAPGHDRKARDVSLAGAPRDGADGGGDHQEGQGPAGHPDGLPESGTGLWAMVGHQGPSGEESSGGLPGRSTPEHPQDVAAQSEAHTSETPSFSVAEKPSTVSRGTERRSAIAARRGFRCALPRRS